MNEYSFQRVAGIAAILAGVIGFAYAVAFVVLHSALLSAVLLLLSGLVSVIAVVAVYYLVRATNEAGASVAALFGLVGLFGAAIHGGYDLATTLSLPATTLPADFALLPNPVDPRGLLTFGVTGIGIFLLSWLIRHTPVFSKYLGTLGYLLGALLVIIYLARLIIFDPTNPILLVPVLLTGFLVSPLWYLWLGRDLLRATQTTVQPHISPQPAA